MAPTKRIFLLISVVLLFVASFISFTKIPRTGATGTVTRWVGDGTASCCRWVSGGPPNSTVYYNFVQSNPGLIVYSLDQFGTYSNSLTLPINLDSSGNGTSAAVYTKAVQAGQTTETICSPQLGCASDSPTNYTVLTPASGVAKIQYLKDGSYVDVPDPLNVLKGDTITFKALPSPADSVFFYTTNGPIDPTWSGSSGATGVGETTTVTFNTASNNNHDYKTVIGTVQNGGSNTANIIVANGVESVTIDKIDAATIFDNNPNTGGGKRVFPDKNDPSDTVSRKRVRVNALTSFGSKQTIYFKSFDLDDPSTDAAPVDANGSAGNDNRGGQGTAAQFGILSAVGGNGTTNSVSAKTDANGVASVDLTVTMQPGDNFIVAASHDSTYLNGLTVNGITLRDSSGNVVGSGTPKAKASQMLTVWRKVHVEVDSMGIVPSTGPQKNSVTGKITSINGTSTVATLVFTDQNLNDGSPKLDDQPPGNGRFENGTIRIGTTGNVTETADLQGNGTSYVQKNTGNGIVIPCTVSKSGETDVTGNVISLLSNVFTISVTDGTLTANFVDGTITVGGVGMVITAVNVTDSSVTVNALADIPFNLVDDDDFNNDDGSNLDGDEGENVSAPDTSLLQNAFAPAYVLPVFDVGDNNDFVPFVLNTDTRNPPASIINTYDFDTVATEADVNFWTVYLLGAYQGWTDQDHDPATDDRVYGIVDAINGQGASVFNEVIRPPEGRSTTEVNNAATTAHEIGHLFNGQHTDGGLMEQSATRSSIVFSDITLNRIRSINHP